MTHVLCDPRGLVQPNPLGWCQCKTFQWALDIKMGAGIKIFVLKLSCLVSLCLSLSLFCFRDAVIIWATQRIQDNLHILHFYKSVHLLGG